MDIHINVYLDQIEQQEQKVSTQIKQDAVEQETNDIKLMTYERLASQILRRILRLVSATGLSIEQQQQVQIAEMVISNIQTELHVYRIGLLAMSYMGTNPVYSAMLFMNAGLLQATMIEGDSVRMQAIENAKSAEEINNWQQSYYGNY